MANVKIFIIAAIFAFFAVKSIYYIAGNFMGAPRMIGSIGTDIAIRFSAFVATLAVFLPLNFIIEFLSKKFNLNNKVNRKPDANVAKKRKMKLWQKVLLAFAVCEVWGLVTIALLLLSGSSSGTIKEHAIIDQVCQISCCATSLITQNIKNVNIPSSLAIQIIFLTQFGVYAIIGLFLSTFILKDDKKKRAQACHEAD